MTLTKGTVNGRFRDPDSTVLDDPPEDGMDSDSDPHDPRDPEGGWRGGAGGGRREHRVDVGEALSTRSVSFKSAGGDSLLSHSPSTSRAAATSAAAEVPSRGQQQHPTQAMLELEMGQQQL